jgi:hypothetical protein
MCDWIWSAFLATRMMRPIWLSLMSLKCLFESYRPWNVRTPGLSATVVDVLGC